MSPSRPPKVVPVFGERKLETVPLSLPKLETAGPAAWLTPVLSTAKSAFLPPEAAPPPPAESAAPKPEVEPRALAEMVEKAKQAAEEEGLKQGREKLDEILRRYTDAVARLEATVQKAERLETGAIVSLAVTVARELMRRQLAIEPQILAENVRAAIQAAGTAPGLKLRLGKADIAVLAAQNPEIFDGAIELVEDETLGVGGCVVEGARVAVDASLEARLEIVADALRALMAESKPAAKTDSEAA